MQINDSRDVRLRFNILSHPKKICINQFNALVDADLPNQIANRPEVSGMPIAGLEIGREIYPVPLLPQPAHSWRIWQHVDPRKYMRCCWIVQKSQVPFLR